MFSKLLIRLNQTQIIENVAFLIGILTNWDIEVSPILDRLDLGNDKQCSMESTMECMLETRLPTLA